MKDLASVQAYLLAIVKNVEKVIVGKQKAVELVLLSLLCGGHVLLEDVPGVGKTSMISAMSRSVRSNFRRIQFTPDVMPSDITGFSLYNQKTGEFEYHSGLLFASFILADEINRASPKTQASLLEVMEERQVTVDGQTYEVPKPFMVMATQNPSDFVGTFPLPEAQMDRFLIRISLGYPEHAEEVGILKRYKSARPLDELSPVARAQDIAALQDMVRDIYVEDSIYDYIVRIVRATRSHPELEMGASPRGSLALFRMSQALAMYKGRDYVTPDDVKPLCEVVLGHRLAMTQEAKLRRVRPEQIIRGIVNAQPVPLGKNT